MPYPKPFMRPVLLSRNLAKCTSAETSGDLRVRAYPYYTRFDSPPESIFPLLSVSPPFCFSEQHAAKRTPLPVLIPKWIFKFPVDRSSVSRSTRRQSRPGRSNRQSRRGPTASCLLSLPRFKPMTTGQHPPDVSRPPSIWPWGLSPMSVTAPSPQLWRRRASPLVSATAMP